MGASGDTARAVVVAEPGAEPEVRDLPVPDLVPGAALVQVEAATLCGSDVSIWRGGTGAKFPYVMGHEGVGRIVDVAGERLDVTGAPVRSGDLVLWTYSPCGHCYFCTVSMQSNLCETSVRFGRSSAETPPYLLGSCAEMHYVPPGSSIVRVPDGVPPGLAASASCALRTIMHAFERLGPVSPHETVVVQGAGPVGLYALATAIHKGARRVLVIGAPAARLALAGKLGAAATFDLDHDGDEAARLEWVREHTDGRRADVVLQCASVAALPEALALVRKGGRVVNVGGGRAEVQVAGPRFTEGVTLVSTRSAEPRHYFQALEMLASGPGHLTEMLSDGYGLDDVSTALQRLASLEDIKPLILPAGGAS